MSEPVEKVTIRVQKSKLHVYPEFKELVTEELGSDVCYVTTALWEAFNQAIKNAPNPADPVTLKFLRQHIQLNIGCNFNYNVKRARRTPPLGPGLPEVQLDRNHILPGLMEMWPTLKPDSKQYWLDRFKEAGIITPEKPRTRKPKPHPSISTPQPEATITKTERRMEQSMTIAGIESVGSVGMVEWRREREEYLAGRGEF
jgi:hypothetical protein